VRRHSEAPTPLWIGQGMITDDPSCYPLISCFFAQGFSCSRSGHKKRNDYVVFECAIAVALGLRRRIAAVQASGAVPLLAQLHDV